MLHASVDACAAAGTTRSQFVGCVGELARDARKKGYLVPWQQVAITFCAAASGQR